MSGSAGEAKHGDAEVRRWVEEGEDLKRAWETRTRSWRGSALARGLTRRAIRRARIESLVLLPLLASVLLVYGYRDQIFGRAWDTTARIVTAVVLFGLGWQFARDVGRALGPWLFKRLEPGTAGTVGFLIRLGTMTLTVLTALRIAGLTPRTLALGGAVTAVVVGLAAQQTFGNVMAGTVLLSARPFRVGEPVRLQGGPLAGSVEGLVSTLGLLYMTLVSRDGPVMVPNAVVLGVAVLPLTEPTAVELRARLRPDITPEDVEKVLRERIGTALRGEPRVTLEEVDGDALVVRISATPSRPSEGPHLASEVLSAVTSQMVHRSAESRAEDGVSGGGRGPS
jgi:small conductance mechanosensitive channel